MNKHIKHKIHAWFSYPIRFDLKEKQLDEIMADGQLDDNTPLWCDTCNEEVREEERNKLWSAISKIWKIWANQ